MKLIIKHLTRPFKIKKLTDDGTIEGYGSVFNVIDSYRDVVMPGAFRATIAESKANDDMPRMLFQHNVNQIIGMWDEMAEDEHGLFMKGSLILENNEIAKTALSLMKHKALKGLSIGYSVPKGGSKWNEEKNVTELSEIKLWETSTVTFGANVEAVITDVRSALEDGIFPTRREFEKLMQDAGFSRKDARLIMSEGFDALLSHDADSAEGILQLTKTLRSMTK